MVLSNLGIHGAAEQEATEIGQPKIVRYDTAPSTQERLSVAFRPAQHPIPGRFRACLTGARSRE
jgi:hypothetical protein